MPLLCFGHNQYLKNLNLLSIYNYSFYKGKLKWVCANVQISTEQSVSWVTFDLSMKWKLLSFVLTTVQGRDT